MSRRINKIEAFILLKMQTLEKNEVMLSSESQLPNTGNRARKEV